MKRSKMIQKIIEKIELIRDIQDGFYVYPENHIMADEILQTVEAEGMTPPYDAFQDGEDVMEWEEEE